MPVGDQTRDVRHVDTGRAPTSRAISPNASKSMTRGYALAPATIIVGVLARAGLAQRVVVDEAVVLATP